MPDTKTPTTSSASAPTPEGAALWDAITSGAFAKAAKAKRKKRSKASPHASVMSELQLLLKESASTPWDPISLTLTVSVTTCRCGTVHRTPSSSILTTFRHKRNGTTQSIANHPSRFNTKLPRDIKEIHTKINFCQHCFQRRATPAETQGDLFVETNPPFPLPLAVPVDISTIQPPPYRSQSITPVITLTQLPQKCKHCTIPSTIIQEN